MGKVKANLSAGSKKKIHQIYKTANGERVVGTTTITGQLDKPALVPAAVKLTKDGKDYKEVWGEKRDIGSLVHYLIMCGYLKIKPDTSEYSPNEVALAENCLMSLYEWEKKNGLDEIILIEKPLVSEAHRFGGTPDLYGRRGRKFVQVDYKTGKGIYDEHIYQTCGGYTILLEENEYPTDEIDILNIGRAEDEEFDCKVISNPSKIETAKRLFLDLLSVYRLRAEIKKIGD